MVSSLSGVDSFAPAMVSSLSAVDSIPA